MQGANCSHLSRTMAFSTPLTLNTRNSGTTRERAGFCRWSASATERRRPRTATLPLLHRVALGERVERPPVWLMRQAGRYMRAFREYSDVIPFRERSENANIVRELSLQPWRKFGTDAVILFSDILTPLPALGVQFDIVPGRGPVIEQPVRTMKRALAISEVQFNAEDKLPFVAEALQVLADDVKAHDTSLLGFVGAPFTLAAYAIEGKQSKHLQQVKRMMYGNESENAILRQTLQTLTSVVTQYAIFQIDNGAHIIQLFDSWAHHLSPSQYAEYSLPYVRQCAINIKKARPNTPLIFFANGIAGKLDAVHHALHDVVNVFAIDWSVNMSDARRTFGDHTPLQGNIDPAILLTASTERIRAEVFECVKETWPAPHILNIGHGVVKETPEEAVAAFCLAAKECSYDSLSSLVGAS